MSVHIASNGHAKPASAADVLLGRPAHTPTPVSPPPAPPNSAPPPQMDEQVTPPKRRKLWIAFAPLAVAALGWLIWAGMPDGASARIDRADLAIAAVEQTVFQEYVATTAQAVPARTVYLDAVSGGRVEEVYVREGTRVEAGDPILKLSNDDVQLRLLSAEAQRVEQINRLQDTRFRLDQNALNLRQQLAEMDYQITRLGRERTRLKALLDKRLAPAKEFEAVDDEYQYFLSRRDLTLSAFQQDSLRTAGQIRSM
ncbi:MAG: biotin/lipoyl-binding protein, partial [Bacteroidota bacterium]